VFDSAGKVLASRTLVNFPRTFTHTDLGRHIRALLRATHATTAAIGGRHAGPGPLSDDSPPILHTLAGGSDAGLP